MQGRRNEMKGAGAELQKGHFFQVKGQLYVDLWGAPPFHYSGYNLVYVLGK